MMDIQSLVDTDDMQITFPSIDVQFLVNFEFACTNKCVKPHIIASSEQEQFGTRFIPHPPCIRNGISFIALKQSPFGAGHIYTHSHTQLNISAKDPAISIPGKRERCNVILLIEYSLAYMTLPRPLYTYWHTDTRQPQSREPDLIRAMQGGLLITGPPRIYKAWLMRLHT